MADCQLVISRTIDDRIFRLSTTRRAEARRRRIDSHLSRRSLGKGGTINYLESLLSGALSQKLGDIEIHEVSVMENDRLDRALHLVALMTVRRDDVHDFTRNTVF